MLVDVDVDTCLDLGAGGPAGGCVRGCLPAALALALAGRGSVPGAAFYGLRCIAAMSDVRCDMMWLQGPCKVQMGGVSRGEGWGSITVDTW